MFHNPGSMQSFGSGFGDGGFQSGGGGFASPAGGMDNTKKHRVQNVTPVTAAHVQQMSYDGSVFSLGDNEISQVIIVGTIIGVERSQTCTTYKVDDATGFVMVKHWNSFEGEDDPMSMKKEQIIFEEGTPVRIFAQVRSFQKTINLNALHIGQVEDLNEVTAHMLECIKFKLVNEAKKKNSNKMQLPSGSGFNAHNNSMSSSFNQSNVMNMGMDSVQAQVWRLIESYQGESGMHVNDIRSTLKNLNMIQIKKALDFLSNEGHIYSTCDDDHFRSTT